MKHAQDSGQVRTPVLLVSSSALYHWATEDPLARTILESDVVTISTAIDSSYGRVVNVGDSRLDEVNFLFVIFIAEWCFFYQSR